MGTCRINYGCRWTNGIHEFIEIKEGISPEEEGSTIASIFHPSFFKIIFGLTGTIDESYERNEIMKIYNLDSFDAPSNFKIKRNVLNLILTEDNEDKFSFIIKNIKNKIKNNQPVLILLLTINETNFFSQNLSSLGINNIVLNDIQKGKEYYILYKAGQCKNVLIATKAGREQIMH